jgi:hypothetical protein
MGGTEEAEEGEKLPRIGADERGLHGFLELCSLSFSLKIRYRQRGCYREVVSEWANASDGRGREWRKSSMEKNRWEGFGRERFDWQRTQ